jgi:hypothetical protein
MDWLNFLKAYQLAIRYCAYKCGCKTSKIMFVVRIIQVRHLSSVYCDCGVSNEQLAMMQDQIMTWQGTLFDDTGSYYILRTYNYAEILHQPSESSKRNLVSYLTSLDLEVEVRVANTKQKQD